MRAGKPPTWRQFVAALSKGILIIFVTIPLESVPLFYAAIYRIAVYYEVSEQLFFATYMALWMLGSSYILLRSYSRLRERVFGEEWSARQAAKRLAAE